MDINASVRAAGLSRNEAAAYVACLRLGEASASAISGESGVNRGIIYHYLRLLERKGLVATVERSGCKRFVPRPPEQLLSLLGERESLVSSALPAMNRLHVASSALVEASVLRGAAGLRSIFNQALVEHAGREMLAVVPTLGYLQPMGGFLKRFHARRAAVGVSMRLIYCDNEAGRRQAVERLRVRLTRVRIIPRMDDALTSLVIFGDSVAILVWSGGEPSGILIGSADVARSQRELFEVLWSNARQVRKRER